MGLVLINQGYRYLGNVDNLAAAATAETKVCFLALN
jgi:hypothetical protein